MGTEEDIAGRIAAVRGAVVDVDFPDGRLPAINDALRITLPEGRQVLLEVQAQIDHGTVRTIALQSTAGLRRPGSASSGEFEASTDRWSCP